jgi:hypothetical protein
MDANLSTNANFGAEDEEEEVFCIENANLVSSVAHNVNVSVVEEKEDFPVTPPHTYNGGKELSAKIASCPAPLSTSKRKEKLRSLSKTVPSPPKSSSGKLKAERNIDKYHVERSKCRYTACFCEENVWCLAKTRGQRVPGFVVFISNEENTVIPSTCDGLFSLPAYHKSTVVKHNTSTYMSASK